MAEAQTSADREAARRRPLVQYVISRYRSDVGGAAEEGYRVDLTPAGSKPSHELITPRQLIAASPSLEVARAAVPAGFKRMARHKDDRVDVVEVWV